MDTLKDTLARVNKRLEASKNSAAEIVKLKEEAGRKIKEAEELQHECVRKKDFDGYMKASELIGRANFEIETAKEMEKNAANWAVTPGEYRDYLSKTREAFTREANKEWKEILKHFQVIRDHLVNVQDLEDSVNDPLRELARISGQSTEIIQSYPSRFADLIQTYKDLEEIAKKEGW